MREILAHAPPLPKDLFGRRSHGGRFGIKSEVFVNARGKIQQRLRKLPSRFERLSGVRGELNTRPNPGRFENKLIRFERRRAAIMRQTSRDFVPSERMLQSRAFVFVYDHFTARFYYQPIVRFLNRKKTELIPEIIRALMTGSVRHDAEFMPHAPMMRKISGRKTCHVVSERHRRLVFVRGLVDDSIDHSPMVTGKVRA